MQTLEIISVNLWQILISLANLLLIFLILKKFLFKPVQKMLDKRQGEVDAQYASAQQAAADAAADKALWAEKLQGADDEADARLKAADTTARAHGDRIVADAKTRAEEILRRAEADAALEKTKAEAAIKEEIVVVSTELAQKMLEREVNAADHKQLIDAFLGEIGGADE
ncbi:MAG: F0F1 ATP synthase subunit B [Clostridia bacterium]|nr:F0F1 ATP synthase subunit B [Clostridia bacterium]